MNSVNILQCTCVPANICNSESKGVEIFMPNRFPKMFKVFLNTLQGMTKFLLLLECAFHNEN